MTLEIQAPSFVIVDGRKLAYDEIRPPNPQGTILLLTGLAAKRQGWYRQMAAFRQTHRVIAIDHRDVGDSDLASLPYTIAEMADDAAAVLRSLGVEHAHVIGISMGGFIALELALRHPDVVEKLVLTSTSAGGKTHVRAGWKISWLLVRPRLRRVEPGMAAKRTYNLIMAPGYCKSHPEDWENIATIARHRPQERAAYRRQLRACVRHDVAGKLAQIRQPTLVIHGTVDPLVPVGNGRWLAAHIPGARYIEYPQTGHIPIIERTADYNRDVLAFLADDAPNA